MNIIKTDIRSVLATRSLSALMWLSVSNKDLFSFDFVRAAMRYIRSHHRRCDDDRGQSRAVTLQTLFGSQDREAAIREVEQKVLTQTNRVAALEADLEIARRDLAREIATLEALKEINEK